MRHFTTLRDIYPTGKNGQMHLPKDQDKSGISTY